MQSFSSRISTASHRQLSAIWTSLFNQNGHAAMGEHDCWQLITPFLEPTAEWRQDLLTALVKA